MIRSDDATQNDNAAGTDSSADIPDHRPKRLLRTCLSSLACSSDFGLQMSRESQRRLLHKATARAFIGDGLSWNWTIWKKHFPTFEPILDFMHAVEYVYAAAVLIHGADHQAAWTCYRRWAHACWSRNVGSVIPELHVWLQSRGLDPAATLDEKQVNLRVKGTEMFWNDADRGGESILQIKAAALCDDSRLETYLSNRPGSPFVRKQPCFASTNSKS